MSAATMPTPAPASPLMTAAEFLAQYGNQSGVELVKGRVVRLPMPGGKHGEVYINAGAIIREFVKRLGLGRVMSNDTFIQVESDPDTFRGADVCFLSYERLPKDQEHRPTG